MQFALGAAGKLLDQQRSVVGLPGARFPGDVTWRIGRLADTKASEIFLTAVATDEQRRFQGFEAGGVDYLLKPVRAERLAAITGGMTPEEIRQMVDPTRALPAASASTLAH